MLEIRHLRSLIALADCGTLSRAAERVHLTQSALSHQLRWLESHYQMPIVTRSGRVLTLTRAGERLVALGRELVAEIQAAERDIAALSDKPSATLAGSSLAVTEHSFLLKSSCDASSLRPRTLHGR